jgi:hypothetical protein
METITNIATAARNSVFGETAATTQSGTEPPAGNAPGKGTPDAPHDPGNVPEQLLTEPGIEPPSGGPAGKGTAEAPFHPGNSPEQVQVRGSTTDTTEKPDSLPTSSTPASKIDNPDPSNPSEMKSAVASNDAANAANTTTTTTTTTTETEPESKPKKTGTAKPGSHSALFGLGPKNEDGGGASGAIHPPKGSGELSGTIDEAGETMGKQAEMEKKGLDEDDTGGYVGLKKAAMEEEEKKRNNGGGFGGGAFATAPESKPPEEEEREPSTFVPYPETIPRHLFFLFSGTLR